MSKTLLILIPILFFILSGYAFKRYYKIGEDKAPLLTKIIFNLTLPATIFSSLVTTPLTVSQSLFLPLAALVIQLGMFGILLFFALRFKVHDHQRCVFITSPLIGNTMLFLAPFVQLAYGDVALSKLMLYHMGNILTIYFLAHAIFRQCNNPRFALKSGLKDTLMSVPVWALIAGVLVSAAGLTVPQPILQILSILKNVNIFLPMFLLGFYFNPVLEKSKLVLGTVAAKIGLGVTFGFLVSLAFTDPLDRMILIFCAAAPVGINSLIYATMYGKDARYASNLISYSMLAGILLLLIGN